MQWHKLVQKYVWDDAKTPYLVRADRLSRAQAESEIFLYAFFLVTLFSIVTLVALAGAEPGGGLAPAVTLYCGSIAASALLLGIRKSASAARYCVTAPIAAFLYVVGGGLQPDLGAPDRLVLVAVTVLWLPYALRVAAIAKAFPHLSEPGQSGP